MLTEAARGVYVIAVTPFTDDGRIDEASTDRMVEFYRDCGVTGMTILGMMGEAPKLDTDEAIAFSRRVVKRARDLPIIVGVSAPGFASMRTLATAVMDAGAAGVMIAPPPSVRTDDQVCGYYDQCVSAIGSDVPFVIQDYPLASGVQMAPSVIRRIVTAHASCKMLKHEDWPGLEKISTVRGYEKDGSMRHISILTGNGGLFLDFEMERGADGAMTGYAFPDMLAEVIRLQGKGQRDAAHDLFDAHLALLRYEQQPGLGLAVRKYVLKRRGAIASEAQRSPGTKLSNAALAEVDYLLRRLATRDPRAAGLAD
ncbi:MAG: dihydrodipicolinate synthase family protein [Hyphomicrobiales bacterium]|nr:MAG: dihydrodipicolinate synthase family protein [Hyphomicrobiales bacterium]